MRRSFLLAAAVAATVATPVLAQPDFSRNPSFGTRNLRTGFTPDPAVVRITAGGRYSARSLTQSGPGCTGTVLDSTMTNAPDVRVNYTAGNGLPLIFSVASSADTTLVINGPDGTWYCNDDHGGSTNPVVRFDNASSGQYDVYIGVFGGGSGIPGELRISEVGPE